MQACCLDVSRAVDNTILFVTHDVSEAVVPWRTPSMCCRPGPPAFCTRSMCRSSPTVTFALKSAPEFRAVEKRLLDLLYARRPGATAVEYAHGCCGQAGRRVTDRPPPRPAGARNLARELPPVVEAVVASARDAILEKPRT